MYGFKLFLLFEAKNNAHSEENLDAAFNKAWNKHGADILDNIRDLDRRTGFKGEDATQARVTNLHTLARHYDGAVRDDLLTTPVRKTYETGYNTEGSKPNPKNLHNAADYIKWDLGELTKNAVRNNHEPQEWYENEPGYEDHDEMPEAPQITQRTLRERPEYRDKDMKIPTSTMPGSHPKYIGWIVQQLKQGSIRPDDLSTSIRENLQKYDHLKRHGLLRDDITNNPREIHNNPRYPYEFDEEDEGSIHPPIRKRDGTMQYDSHASADFNNFSVKQLHRLVNHPVYDPYFAGPTHEEAMAGLKEGHDYDVIHDSTPGGPHRDRLTPVEQDLKRGVKVYHAKTEEAAHALAICPGTNKRTAWCTAVPGQHGGNQAFHDYDKHGPIFVMHGEPGGPNLALTTNHQESRFHDDAPVMRQVHVATGQYMNEDDEHDQHTEFEASTSSRLHTQFPSFDGGEIKEHTRVVLAKNATKYDWNNAEDTNRRTIGLNQTGRVIQRDWHLHKQFGYHPEALEHIAKGGNDYVASVRSNLGAAGSDRLVDTMERIKPFEGFNIEQTHHMDAIFGPGNGNNRSSLITNPNISHTTKHLIAKYGSDSDVAHLVAHHPDGRGKFSDKPLHDIDDKTAAEIMRRHEGDIGYLAARGSSNSPTDMQIAKGRVVARFRAQPHHTPERDNLLSNYYNKYMDYNDLPIKPRQS